MKQEKGKPKVLIFIDWYLPGFKAGGPIRSCANLVSHLKDQYDFYIITRDTDYISVTPYETVYSDSWNVVDGSKVYYVSRKALKSKVLRALIKEVEPDVVYVNGIYSFYFSILPIILSKQLGYKNILVAGRGMLAQSAILVKGIKKKLFFKFSSLYGLYQDVTFHATNEMEEAGIRAVVGEKVAIKIAPNLPEVASIELQKSLYRPKDPGVLKLVSIARIAPEKNTKFALKILEQFTGTGKISLHMFGPIYNESYWEECEALIAGIPENVTVTYKGILEKSEVPRTLQQSHVLFMPTKGENFGHVILESLTTGCPVLISDRTPWKDLQGKGIGYDISLDDISEFHNAIEQLALLDQEHYDRLSRNAFEFAKAYSQDENHLKVNRDLLEFE